MGYTDRAGIDSRANSALCRAELMAGEPILTDTSSAAYSVRAEAAVLSRKD